MWISISDYNSYRCITNKQSQCALIIIAMKFPYINMHKLYWFYQPHDDPFLETPISATDVNNNHLVISYPYYAFVTKDIIIHNTTITQYNMFLQTPCSVMSASRSISSNTLLSTASLSAIALINHCRSSCVIWIKLVQYYTMLIVIMWHTIKCCIKTSIVRHIVMLSEFVAEAT